MVVQNDVFNRIAIATSVVCLSTSQFTSANALDNVLLKKGEANLPKATVVNVSQIRTVEKAERVECAGKLSGTTARATYFIYCSNGFDVAAPAPRLYGNAATIPAESHNAETRLT